MSVILNEAACAEYIINQGKMGRNPTSALFLLAKYYRHKKHMNTEQISAQLKNFMKLNYKNFNPVLWDDTIEDIVSKSTRYPLREIDSVGVTQSELDKISQLPDIKHRQILFTMLCYAKLYNAFLPNNNNWVNSNIPEIFKTAAVSVRRKNDRFLYLNDIANFGLISFPNKNDNLNIRVNFADMNGESVMEVDDFRELGYEYLNYIGEGRFVRCSICKRLIRQTGRRSKYCAECKCQKQKEWQKNSMKKHSQKRNNEVL